MTNWPVLTEHDAIFLQFCHHMLLVLFSWDFATQSEFQLLGPIWALPIRSLAAGTMELPLTPH